MKRAAASQDPTLNGHYATQMVQGMQHEDANGHPATLAYLKHYTAYSTESNRGHDDYQVSMHDYFETYLPQAPSSSPSIISSYPLFSLPLHTSSSPFSAAVPRRVRQRPGHWRHVLVQCD